MNKRYAPIGLAVAGLATLAAFSLYFVQREWNLPLQISIALIVVGLAAFVLLDPDRARNVFSGRQARYGSNAFVLTLAFLGITIVINYLVYQNALDWKLRWDWTEDRENTLAPETIDILETLPEMVQVRGYFTVQNVSNEDRAKDLLDDFRFFGGDNFDYELIDPGENPIAATEDGIDRDGTLVLQLGANKELVTTVSELEIASALVRLLNPGDSKVYFLIGHGEFNFEETGDTSINQLKLALEGRNYTPESLSLLATNTIPEDANVLVVPGPNFPLTSDEVALIAAYLDQGGSLVVLYEPVAITQFGTEPDPLTDYLVQAWGIELGNNIVLDFTSQEAFLAIAAQYGKHVITDKLQSLATVFPTARTVRSNSDVDGIVITELILTAQQSWAETDIASINSGQVAPDEGVDMLGPVSLAVAASNSLNNSRVVVIGDADFITNQYYSAYGNADFVLNSINWAANQEDIISLTPKNVTQRTLDLPPQAYILNLILFGIVIVVPGLVLISGVVVWFQRRRRA